MLTDEEVARVAETIDRQCGLAGLYLFGSERTGRVHAESDVDLAVLVERLPDAVSRLSIRADLEDELHRPVDLVFLNDASPIVVRQVLQHGKLLRDPNPRRRAEFVMRMISEYADLKRVRAPVERALVDRMKHAG